MSEKKCNSCKKDPKPFQNKLMFLGLGVLFFTVYGIVEIIKKLISLLD